MEDMVTLLLNSGTAIVVVAYFIWKDAKLTKENTDILQQVKALLENLMNKEGE